jgi:Acyl-CoA dehydrogenase, middle domain
MTSPHEGAAASRLNAALAALPALAAAIGKDSAAREARRELPNDGFALFRQSGLGLLRIPAEWGGLGGSLEDLFHVVATLAAKESNVAHALRIHFDLTESLLLSPHSEFNDTQIQRVLEGAIFGGASTERGTSRPGEIGTVLRRDGDHYRVTGKKYYSTGTAFSDYARINVQDEQDNPLVIIIPVGREGVRVLDDWDGMGQRMTASGSLVLEDVQVFAHEVSQRGYTTLAGRHGSALRRASSAISWRTRRTTCSSTAARYFTVPRHRRVPITSSSRWWATWRLIAMPSMRWCNRTPVCWTNLPMRYAARATTPKSGCCRARLPRRRRKSW